MAIVVTTGAAANSSVAVASKALGSFNLTALQTVVVAIALGSTSSSISTVTDTKGNTYVKQAAQNGTGIRIEIWTSLSVAVQTSNIITANITGGNTTIALAAEEYAGVTAIGNNGVINGGSSSINMYENNVLTTQASNFVVGALGFTCVSGDTLTAVLGTSRQSSIPAATAVGIALYDNTSVLNCIIPVAARISTARNWATAAVELKSGGTANSAISYAAGATAPAFGSPVFITSNPLYYNPPVTSGQIFPPSR